MNHINSNVYIIKNGVVNGNFIKFQDKNDQHREIEIEILKPFISTTPRTPPKSMQKAEANSWVIFPYTVEHGVGTIIPENDMMTNFPKAWEYMEDFEDDLSSRDMSSTSAPWYAYGRPQGWWIDTKQEKIIVQVSTKEYEPVSLFDDGGMIYFQTGATAGHVGLYVNPESEYSIFYILGIINSKAIDWVAKMVGSQFQADYIAHGKSYLLQYPIKKINFDDDADKVKHDEIVVIVKEIVDLREQQKNASTTREKERINTNIQTSKQNLETKINELYGIIDLIQFAD